MVSKFIKAFSTLKNSVHVEISRNEIVLTLAGFYLDDVGA
jgi:hypothetical protein